MWFESPKPVLVLDNGQTPDEWKYVYVHTGAAMYVTMLKTGREITIFDKEVLTLHGTADGLREAREQLDEYLAKR